ncbi:MAG: MFS transporter [Gemmobacter sp.]|nr:MFS transporter [Gemmobacter sp.]
MSTDGGQASVRLTPTWLLILISLPQSFGLNVMLPVLPLLMLDFGIGTAGAQMAISAFLYGSAAGQLLLGPVSDAVGRRPVLLGGLVLFGATTLVCALTDVPQVFMLARFVQGLGAVAGSAMARAMLRDGAGGAQAAAILSRVIVGMSFGPFLAPVLGGLVAAVWDWRVIFLAMGALNLAVLLVAWRACTETHRAETGGNGPVARLAANAMRLFALRSYRRAVLAQASAGAMYFIVVFGIGAIGAREFGLSSVEMGAYFLLNAAGTLTGASANGVLVVRFGVRRMGFAGLALCVAGAAATLAVGSAGPAAPWMVFAPLFVAQVGICVFLSNTIATSQEVSPDIAGAAAGIAGATQMAAGATAMVLSGLAFDLAGVTAPIVWVTVALVVLAAIGAGLTQHKAT